MQILSSKWLRRLLLAFFTSYLLLVAVLVIIQRSLIYSPGLEGSSLPTDYGVPFERIEIPATTGPVRKGWFVDDPSMHVPAKPKPILVYCQGNGGGLSDRAKVSALFNSVGVDTVMLSYRGFGDSGFGEIEPTEAHIYEDAQAAYDFARARVPENKILVWGHSLGAAVAAYLGARNHPAAVILESPFKSTESMVPVRYPWLFVPSFLIFDKFSTIEYVKNIDAPLLVLVAQDDTIIPPSFGKAVFEAANEPKTFLPLIGTGHNNLPENFEKFREPISKFISKVTG